MNTPPFRSHLMQQFYSAAKNQSRPPLVLASTFRSKTGNDEGSTRRVHHHRASTTSSPMLSSLNALEVSHSLSSSSRSFREASSEAKSASNNDATQQHHVYEPSILAQSLQQMISSRRTVSNFLHHPPTSLPVEGGIQCQQILSNAIRRAVECASTAPNHKMSEPTTFHRILSPSAASERLLDISYEVTYQRLLLNKLSGVEACRNEAMRKREKWSKIPAFIVATVGGMEDQYNEEEEQSPYAELPLNAPHTIQQLEDYASSCASIQNLLLSLHSEGIASKWATGTIIRTHALRNLIGCKKDDMVVGLIMVGWTKQVPRMPRRRRVLEGDVLKDVNI